MSPQMIGLIIAGLLGVGYGVDKWRTTSAQTKLGMKEIGLKEKEFEAGIKGKKLGIIEKRSMTKEAMAEAKSLKVGGRLHELTMADRAMAAQNANNATIMMAQLMQAMTASQGPGITRSANPNVPIFQYLPR